MKLQHLSLVIASAAILAACGGGGGGGSAPAPAPYVAPPAPTVPLVTSVPAATYAAGSEELAAFNLLNAERSRCGFGLLAQNTALDTAAKAHAEYNLLNNNTGHYEVANDPGFTGVAPTDRVLAAGYGSANSFVASESNVDGFVVKLGMGSVGLRGLLNAPYHQLNLMKGYVDVGLSAREKADIGIAPNNRFVLNIDLGYQGATGQQVATAGSVLTYPCDGSSGVDRSLYGENPNPVPGRNLATSPLGSSVGVTVDNDKTLVISSASMTKVATGTSITLATPVTGSNDPNQHLARNQGFVSADSPLEANTQYQVTITGTSSGVQFSRTFQFTTGN